MRSSELALGFDTRADPDGPALTPEGSQPLQALAPTADKKEEQRKRRKPDSNNKKYGYETGVLTRTPTRLSLMEHEVYCKKTKAKSHTA